MNQRQYNQAQDTPFGSGYLASRLGLDAETQAVADLLQGNLQLDYEQIPLLETLAIINELGKQLQL
jgi:hypothetical protein